MPRYVTEEIEEPVGRTWPCSSYGHSAFLLLVTGRAVHCPECQNGTPCPSSSIPWTAGGLALAGPAPDSQTPSCILLCHLRKGLASVVSFSSLPLHLEKSPILSAALSINPSISKQYCCTTLSFILQHIISHVCDCVGRGYWGVMGR